MKQDELIQMTNSIIGELVYDKNHLQKAYNYYNGKYDPEQFKYLEENFGLGNPTSVIFIPLIKKHIDALVGEYLGTPIIPKVQCKDTKTIGAIDREKQLYIVNEVQGFLKSKLKNTLLNFINGKDITDVNIESQLQKLTENLENNFMSEYEIAAQNVIEYVMQSRDTDMLTKLRTLLLDLLITGYTYFRVKPSFNKTNVKIEVLDPLNTFVDSHPESPYAKHASRAVVRKWMTKEQIIAEYGNDLTKDEIKELRESQIGDFDSDTRIVFSPASTGIRAGEEVRPGYPSGEYSRFNNRLIPVYEVEWIETDKDFVMQRYETVKIGAEMYIIRGKNEQVFRTQDNPNLCTLSVNGVYFTNRSNEPYSLVLACADMQDRYNILHFYRDQLIASSGTVGDILDVAMLPEFLGVNLPERIQKWIAYKKTGTALIDSSQEGRLANGGAALNTIFNGFDDTIKVQSIQAIQMAIESIENTTSSITGVFRERLNGIEQRDAVTNVKQSANNSFIITKHYYQQMDLVVTEILMDALNCGKIVFKKGLKGSIILGDYQQKIFTALPEHFTTSDHDIRILTSTEIIQDMQQIKTLVPELMKVGTIDPQIIFDALTSKSLTELKTKVSTAMKKQKEENNALQKLQEQAEQLQNELKKTQQELQKAQQQVQSLNEAKLKLEQEKLKREIEIDWFKAKTDRTFKNESIEVDKKKVEIELLQLRDGNPLNDQIRMI